MGWLKIVGLGPGSKDLVPPLAQEIIASAEVLIGGERHLQQWAKAGQEVFRLDSRLEELLSFLQSRRGRRVVILASGDPGLYGILSWVRRHFGREEIEVIPGISSIQLAFARLALPWQEAVIRSLHGRWSEKIWQDVARSPVAAIFLDDKVPLGTMASAMLAAGLGERKLYLCYNLSYPDERIVACSAQELVKEEEGKAGRQEGKRLCLMVIVDESRLALFNAGNS